MQTDLKEFITKRNNLQPEKGPEHEYLKAFVGHWQIEGQNGADAPESPGAKVTGVEEFEMMEGEYFLLSKSNRTHGGQKFAATGWIGYDSYNDEYLNYTVFNSGHMRIYEIEVAEEKLIFSGQTERAMMTIDDDVLTVKWEVTKDGKTWGALCDYTGRRIQ